MYHPKDEGTTHINIYSKSQLELGKNLSNFTYSPFICDGLEFASVEAYWYWLRSGRKHDNLRGLCGFKAKNEGRKYPIIHIDGFNELCLEAIRCKLRQNKKIRNQLKESTLPLTHYYYFGDIDNPSIVRLDQYNWIVDEFERIRTLLQNSQK